MWPCPIGFYPAVSLFLQDYPEFLQAFFSPLVSQLSSTQPQFEDSELHKLRHAVLEVLAKLPTNDKLQPYLPQLMQVRTVSRGTPPRSVVWLDAVELLAVPLTTAWAQRGIRLQHSSQRMSGVSARRGSWTSSLRSSSCRGAQKPVFSTTAVAPPRHQRCDMQRQVATGASWSLAGY
jgi:hypothetical protein